MHINQGETIVKLTKHASIRQQQRGIPSIVVDLLLDYGTFTRTGEGATMYYFDKMSRRRVRTYAGPLSGQFEEYLDYYAVVASDGRVITVAPRIKRIRH